MKIRLKAFTVLEFIVAMALMLLIVTFGYQSLDFFREYSMNSDCLDEEYVSFNRLDYLLQNDAKSCEKIILAEDSLIFDYLLSKTSYVFEKEFMIRSLESSRDTFFFTDISADMKMQKLDVTSGWVDLIHLSMHGKKNPYKLFVKKIYSSENLMIFEQTK